MQNEILKLSIIVPMYKVEIYLERCLNSLVRQDLRLDQYEIICVNDGSPDNCSIIVKNFQKLIPNIVLLEQHNQGVSIARNNGLTIARGEYILFIDPDDYIEEDSLGNILEILSIDKLDVGLTGYVILDVDHQKIYTFNLNNYDDKVRSGISFFDQYLRANNKIKDPDRSVAIFFRREFLKQNNLRYIQQVPYLEDGELMSRIFCLAERVLFVNKPFFIRTTNIGSATNSQLFFSQQAIDGFLKAASNLKKFQKACKTSEQKEFINQPIIKFTVLFLTSIGFKAYMANYKELTLKLRQATLDNLATKSANTLYASLAFFYNLNVVLFYAFWFLRKANMYVNNKVRSKIVQDR